MKMKQMVMFLMVSLSICSIAYAQKATAADENKKKSQRSAEQAQTLFEANKYPESLSSALQAISLDKNNSNGFFWAGMASMVSEKNDDAIGYFEQALALNSDANTNFYLAQSYLNSSDRSRALPKLLKVLQLDPNFSEAYDRLGRYYLFDLQDAQKALPYLKSYVDQNRHEYSLYHLGIAYSRNLQFPEAMKCFVDAQKIVADNKSEDKWIIDNLAWAIDMTNKKEPLNF